MRLQIFAHYLTSISRGCMQCVIAIVSVSMCIKVYWRHREDNVMFEMAAPVGGVPGVAKAPPSSPKQQQPRVRVEFPETWLWSETNTGYHLADSVICGSSQFNSRSACCQSC